VAGHARFRTLSLADLDWDEPVVAALARGARGPLPTGGYVLIDEYIVGLFFGPAGCLAAMLTPAGKESGLASIPMEIIPDKRKVVGLVEQAYKGEICLPNFQRDFVWTREEVADLMRSIIRGYFIGSLLLLRCDKENPPFAPIFLRGAKPTYRDARPELLVLDGQQRLSSLMYALTAPDLSLKDSSQRRWFFLNLDLLLSEPDNDEIIFDRAKRELRGLDTPGAQYKQRILPCTELLTQQSFYAWRDGFEDWLRSNAPDQLGQYRSEWRAVWTNAATAFQTFEAPLVELPRVDESDGESIGRVCAIFEKLNSTGVDLSVYDLLTARLYRSGIRLHDLWEAACRTHPRLRAWSKGKADEHKFGVLVLRTLALLRGLDPKPRILIDLSPANFEADWRRAAAAIERALEITELVGPDGFGVFAEKWLPGFCIIPILAALRAEIDAQAGRTRARGPPPLVLVQRLHGKIFERRRKQVPQGLPRNDAALVRWQTGAGGFPRGAELDRRTGISHPRFGELRQRRLQRGLLSARAPQRARLAPRRGHPPSGAARPSHLSAGVPQETQDN
jgi:Protein of unknown function DUF262